MKKLLTIFIFTHLSVTFSLAQGGTAEQDRVREQVYQEANSRSKQTEQYERPASGLPKIITKLSQEDKLKLSPPTEDVAKYSQFLKNRNTGIVKLLELTNCDSKIINVNDTKCLEVPQIFGNGAYYSFSARSYVEIRSLDIKYFSNKFVAFQKGLFTDLGDIPLENFDFSKEVKLLKKFNLGSNDSLFSRFWSIEERKKFATGVEIGGKLYKNEIPLKVETTYLFRSDKYKLPKRILAFRVIRQDVDESVVLIWKEL